MFTRDTKFYLPFDYNELTDLQRINKKKKQGIVNNLIKDTILPNKERVSAADEMILGTISNEESQFQNGFCDLFQSDQRAASSYDAAKGFYLQRVIKKYIDINTQNISVEEENSLIDSVYQALKNLTSCSSPEDHIEIIEPPEKSVNKEPIDFSICTSNTLILSEIRSTITSGGETARKSTLSKLKHLCKGWADKTTIVIKSPFENFSTGEEYTYLEFFEKLGISKIKFSIGHLYNENGELITERPSRGTRCLNKGIADISEDCVHPCSKEDLKLEVTHPNTKIYVKCLFGKQYLQSLCTDSNPSNKTIKYKFENVLKEASDKSLLIAYTINKTERMMNLYNPTKSASPIFIPVGKWITKNREALESLSEFEKLCRDGKIETANKKLQSTTKILAKKAIENEIGNPQYLPTKDSNEDTILQYYKSVIGLHFVSHIIGIPIYMYCDNLSNKKIEYISNDIFNDKTVKENFHRRKEIFRKISEKCCFANETIQTQPIKRDNLELTYSPTRTCKMLDKYGLIKYKPKETLSIKIHPNYKFTLGILYGKENTEETRQITLTETVNTCT